MSDDDDDYMSNSWLSHSDITPGILPHSRSYQRFLKIEQKRSDIEKQKKPLKKNEIERNLLEEGLNKPISSDSKGFSLLAKMGYKVGMSLGKKRGDLEGIKEPIHVPIKISKTGLGHETHELEKQKERCELHLKHMEKNAKEQEIITEDFLTRKKFAVIQKKLISDLNKARKTCEELDYRHDRSVPHCYWFWPIYGKSKNDLNLCSSISNNFNSVSKISKICEPLNRIAQSDNVKKYYVYANGNEAVEDIDFFELNEHQLQEKIEQITLYLRETHNYCMWCGTAYTSKENLMEQCPGLTRELHDDCEE